MEAIHTHTEEPDLATLVDRAAKGDDDAWHQIVHRFSSLVWAVPRSHGLGRVDAADVYQTTWLRLVEHLGRLREPAALAGWLAATARNEAIRVSRHSSREQPAEDHDTHLLAPERDTPEVALLLDEERRRVLVAFAQLSQRCQRVLRVVAAGPVSNYDQVAASLDMPVGSLGPTRGRCLSHLRRLLEGDDL